MSEYDNSFTVESLSDQLVDRHKETDRTRKCLVEEFTKNQQPQDRGQPLFISCPCPRCSPYTLG